MWLFIVYISKFWPKISSSSGNCKLMSRKCLARCQVRKWNEKKNITELQDDNTILRIKVRTVRYKLTNVFFFFFLSLQFTFFFSLFFPPEVYISQLWVIFANFEFRTGIINQCIAIRGSILRFSECIAILSGIDSELIVINSRWCSNQVFNGTLKCSRSSM